MLPARTVAPRLAESQRLVAVTNPLSPAERWHQDFLMRFLRDQLRRELKRRGHSPTGLKEQLARRLVRGSSARAESIWRLAAWIAAEGCGRDTFPLGVLETEQSLVEYFRSTSAADRGRVP